MEIQAVEVLGEVAREEAVQQEVQGKYMKRIFWIVILGLGSLSALNAQIYSYSNLAKSFSTAYSTSSPRMQAMGGVHSTLGADISSISGNPAGLGFYNRSEVALGIAYFSATTQSNYLSETASKTNSFVQWPIFGLVLGSNAEPSSSLWHGSFGIGYSRQVIFAQPISLTGVNNRSSLLDRFIEKANDKGATGQSLDDEFHSFSKTADSPEAVAYQAYLINPNTKTGGVPFQRYEPKLPTRQQGTADNEGALSQWDISYGTSYVSKFYVGLGLHFSKINATSTTSWQEEFVGANYISGLLYQEKLVNTGSGLSATLGMIYKLNSNLRVSFAFHTPMFFDQMNERYEATLSPKVFGIPSIDSKGNPITITRVGAVKLTPNEFTYQLTTPFKLSGGAAYFFGKRGLLSLDLEYVNYPGMRVSSAELSATDNINFENKYNGQTQKNFQSALNIKLGTEIRLSANFNLRGGVATWGNSYSPTYDSIDRTVFQFSYGVGYRANQFYIDLAAYQRASKDAFTPYALKNTADYSSANLNLTNLQLMIGGGVYF
jgi:hypothetical protein